jgi:DNA-binding PadR family transcriptional regulator
MTEKKRERGYSGFLMRQRAFLKLYLITYAEESGSYGFQALGLLKDKFKQFGFKPQHSEIYRALHELMEEDILKRKKAPKDDAKYQEIAVYYIHDRERAKAYKRLVKADLDRCMGILHTAIRDNY